MARYYSTQRPVMLGCFPKKAEVVEIKNFDEKIFCEEIGKEAWGYIEYQTELTKKEADAYELIFAGMKTYYCVTSSIDDKGKVRAAITSIVEAVSKPENSFKSLKRKDIYTDWFESREEAEKLVKEAETA